MSNKYTYSITKDFPNQKVSLGKLSDEIQNSSIITALDYLNATTAVCDIWFKNNLLQEDYTTLSGIVSNHDGINTPDYAPMMDDGRPIVRSDSRPIGWQTMFTMCGDDQAIGDGKEIYWDFSNDDDLVTTSGVVPDGYKMKQFDVQFCDPVHIKEGTIYFHSAPKKSYLDFSIVCPSGNYYYDRDSNPQLADGDVTVVKYVNHHFFSGSCSMGDELNTESCSENTIPSNYYLRVDIYVPDSDNSSYGYGELELYRLRTCLLPNEEI